MHPIVLLTDFGESDPFVGTMKGVILSRCPEAIILDLTHQVPPQDIRAGAFYLMQSFPYFPKGSLFVCVIDPGVGSERRILWARTDSYQFLAPDNGVLSWVDRVEPLRQIRQVSNRTLFLNTISRTFHGRDIFAPVAAELARGAGPHRLGPVISGMERIPFPETRKLSGKIQGTIIAIDRFGNAISNIPEKDLGAPARMAIRFKSRNLGPVHSHYSVVNPGKPLALIGSFGFVELSVRNGSFVRSFRAKIGDSIEATHAR